MPTYTYNCENCGHQFDKHQSFSDQALKICPNCRKHTLQKVYKPSGVSFKGSGFYVTDKAKPVPSGKKSVKAKENGKAETKAEKGEAKIENKSDAAGEKNKPKPKEE